MAVVFVDENSKAGVRVQDASESTISLIRCSPFSTCVKTFMP